MSPHSLTLAVLSLLLLAPWAICVDDARSTDDGIVHGKAIRISAHTLNRSAHRAENLHKNALQRRIEAIRLDTVSFAEVPLDLALRALRKRIAEAGGPKVNFFIKGTPAQRKEKISLDLEEVPASVAIRYAAMAAGMAYKYDEFVVSLEPAPPGYKW